jgi:hypothetical protein
LVLLNRSSQRDLPCSDRRLHVVISFITSLSVSRLNQRDIPFPERTWTTGISHAFITVCHFRAHKDMLIFMWSARYCCLISTTIIMCWILSVKLPNVKFRRNPPSRSRVVNAYGRTEWFNKRCAGLRTLAKQENRSRCNKSNHNDVSVGFQTTTQGQNTLQINLRIIYNSRMIPTAVRRSDEGSKLLCSLNWINHRQGLPHYGSNYLLT